MDYLFNVSFTSSSKPQYFLSNYEVKLYDLVVVESLRGQEIGKIMTKPTEYTITEGQDIPYSYIIRIANDEDLIILDSNRKAEAEIVKNVQNEANKLSLPMKVTTAEYTLDRSKLNISYLSEDRVDFRDLLKVLAGSYHCRIELRQIGPRDKAKLVGGLGICGLPLCCSTFLNEFDGISITMAKNQMLALNIPKLSGQCGKLICCLKYEDSTYTAEKENLPRIGLHVQIDGEVYKIASINIITKIVRLESSENILNLPLSQIEDKIITNYNPNNAPKAPKKEEAPIKEDKNEDLNKQNNENKVEVTNANNNEDRPQRFNQRNNHNNNRRPHQNFRQNNNQRNNQQTNSNEQTNFVNEENEANMIAFRVNENMTNNSQNNSRNNNNYHSNRNKNFHHNNNHHYSNKNNKEQNNNKNEKN